MTYILTRTLRAHNVLNTKGVVRRHTHLKRVRVRSKVLETAFEKVVRSPYKGSCSVLRRAAEGRNVLSKVLRRLSRRHLESGNTPGEKLKCHPFWGSALSIKQPQDNFSRQNAKWCPPKCKLTRGDFCVFLKKKTAEFLYKNCRLEVANLYFGGCRFTFWRVPIYILEAEIVLGVLYRKGVIPRKGGTLDSLSPLWEDDPFRVRSTCGSATKEAPQEVWTNSAGENLKPNWSSGVTRSSSSDINENVPLLDFLLSITSSLVVPLESPAFPESPATPEDGILQKEASRKCGRLPRNLGHDRGAQNAWEEENILESAPSREFLDHCKRASGLLKRGSCYRRNRAITPEKVVRFSCPLFFHPPSGILCKWSGISKPSMVWQTYFGYQETTGITKTTNTTQTATNKGVECWLRGNHGNHTIILDS